MAKDERASIYFDRQSMRFEGLTAPVLSKLKESYNHIDVEAELEKMSFWLLSSKGKKRRGTINFVLNWLKSASAAKSSAKQIHLACDSGPLTPYLESYRKELWKDREHILRLNCLKQTS